MARLDTSKLMQKKLLEMAEKIARKNNPLARYTFLIFIQSGFCFMIELKNKNNLSVMVNSRKWEKTYHFQSSATGEVEISKQKLKLILKALCKEAEVRGLGRDPMLGYDEETLRKMGKL